MSSTKFENALPSLRIRSLDLIFQPSTPGELFAKCPVDKYPGVAVEAVTDSSRYFVIRLLDDDGRNAFIGMGFADRYDRETLGGKSGNFRLSSCSLEVELSLSGSIFAGVTRST